MQLLQLNVLPFWERKRVLNSLSKRELRDAFASAGPVKDWKRKLLSLSPDSKPCAFHGKNSLPVFSAFEKSFFSQGDHVYGFNSSWIGRKLQYPGYFKVTDLPSGELLFDYTADFPHVKFNGRHFPTSQFKNNDNFLFRGLQDTVREIAPGILIGEAKKLKNNHSRSLNIFFCLLKIPSTPIELA